MLTFVGWTPNVTGRLSFSRIGDTYCGDRVLCNHTATPDGKGFLFGAETRTSRDGPLPAWLIRFIGRVPDIQFLAFLEVEAAELPYPTPKLDGADCAVSLEMDGEGALAGEVIFLSKGKVLDDATKASLETIRRLTREGRTPQCSVGTRLENYQKARETAEVLWKRLEREFAAGRKTPAFGRVKISLLRTGECRVDVNPALLFTTSDMKAAQRAGQVNEDSNEAKRAAAAAARQSFFFIRDLAHQHYHHPKNSDLLTTTYTWTPSEDEAWRRETQYGLVRLAIAARRRDTAEAFKRALGFLAYAEAFQKHLCGWRLDESRKPAKSIWGFAYDFTALRQSIDASLKVRELRDTQLRQRLFFVFGFIITCLGLVLSGLRSPNGRPETAEFFMRIVDRLSAHPIMALMAAGLLAWLLDLIFTKVSVGSQWVGGISRLTDAAMGQMMVWWRNPQVSFSVTVILTGLVMLGIGAICGVTFYWAVEVLQKI